MNEEQPAASSAFVDMFDFSGANDANGVGVMNRQSQLSIAKEEVKGGGQKNNADCDAASVDGEDDDQGSYGEEENRSVMAPIPSSMHFKATIDQLDTSRETT